MRRVNVQMRFNVSYMYFVGDRVKNIKKVTRQFSKFQPQRRSRKPKYSKCWCKRTRKDSKCSMSLNLNKEPCTIMSGEPLTWNI